LSSEPADKVRLAADSENALSGSLQRLFPGQQGWITLHDAWRLFSFVDEEYAFGEMDEDGKNRLEQFVAEETHRAVVDFMPTEGRVYFTRQ
jgi:hypothetical protein